MAKHWSSQNIIGIVDEPQAQQGSLVQRFVRRGSGIVRAPTQEDIAVQIEKLIKEVPDLHHKLQLVALNGYMQEKIKLD